jgi:hypothetical protein
MATKDLGRLACSPSSIPPSGAGGSSRGIVKAQSRLAKARSTSLASLVVLPELVVMPVPRDMVVSANYEGVDLDADPDLVL